MLKDLEPYRDIEFDSIAFLPNSFDKNAVDINSGVYVNPGESSAENMYHIAIFKLNDNSEIYDKDIFDAVLLDPLEYISTILPNDYYGVISRKTTNSPIVMQKILELLKII